MINNETMAVRAAIVRKERLGRTEAGLAPANQAGGQIILRSRENEAAPNKRGGRTAHLPANIRKLSRKWDRCQSGRIIYVGTLPISS